MFYEERTRLGIAVDSDLPVNEKIWNWCIMDFATRLFRRVGKPNPHFRPSGAYEAGNRACPKQSIKRHFIYGSASLLQRFAAAAMVAAAIMLFWAGPPAAMGHSWVGNTSGPFFTGTADVEPLGSWYYEPYFFDSIAKSSYQINTLQKLAIGLPLDLEFDILVPLIFNQAETPATNPVGQFGAGDVSFQIKKELTKESDEYNFLAMPTMSLIGVVTVPTGNYENLSPALADTDQTGNGTYDLGLGIQVHKMADPFQFYLQLTDYVMFPSDVQGPYYFDNSAPLPLGTSLHMVDGNLFSCSAAIEHVLDPRIGFGYLLEIYGETQGSGNLVFGRANAPAWSALWLAPELEVTWPNQPTFAISWGAGVALPVAESNYPSQIIPMATATFYFNTGGVR